MLYDFSVYVPSDMPHQNTLAVQGDYVLLPYNTKGTMMYRYTVLHFAVSVNDKQQSSSIEVFHIKDSKLLHKTIKSEKFRMIDKDVDLPTLTPFLTRRYFDHCDYRKCKIGEYIYQVKNTASEANFNVTVGNYTQGLTKIWLVVFDNREYFQEYMNGGDTATKAVKSFEINSKNFLFVFNGAKMRTSSYYYFVIHDVEGSAQWFTAVLAGLHVYYNASFLTPLFKLDQTNNFSHSVNSVDGYFLAYVKGERATGVPTTDQLFNITQWMDSPTPNYTGLGVVWGCFSLVVVLALLVGSLACCVRVCKHCKRSSEDAAI